MLINCLSSLGFSSSYHEVKRYERCAAVSQGTDIMGIDSESDTLVQFVADNVDHNMATLDANGTFHGMGIIATVTPGKHISRRVPRVSASLDDAIAIGKIPIRFYMPSGNRPDITYDELPRIHYADKTVILSALWKVVWPIHSPTPGWSGVMQVINSNQKNPGQSTITFLPMIDMKSTDMSCIYSTLLFVSSEADRQHIQPIITFDQPLWWKAKIIISSDRNLNNIVLRLGVFHAQMSFLGSIGRIMSGTGLHEDIYASNAIDSILNGKAVSRAVRGHFLVDSALNAVITSQAFGFCIIDEELDDSTAAIDLDPILVRNPPFELEEAARLLQDSMIYDAAVEDLISNPVLGQIESTIQRKKESLAEDPTSRLWLQYSDMVNILRNFIKAERTGNWTLHLRTMMEMLPYFAAAGHNLYTKSVYLYLQDMTSLPEDFPEIYESFMKGHHVVRRSDGYWAGLSTDLVIEQVLMRSIKSTSGLTRGRGMSEGQRAQWLMSMPACADMNAAMQELTNHVFMTSLQHKDITEARLKRDDNDKRRLLKFLLDRNPFESDPSIRNIATGVTGDEKVNADNARKVGLKIIDSMKGENAFSYIFRRKEQIIPLNHKMFTIIGDEPLEIDSQLLFQRLMTAAPGLFDGDFEDVFRFELSTLPAALFDPSGFLREAAKSSLADAIFSMINGSEMPIPDEQRSPRN